MVFDIIQKVSIDPQTGEVITGKLDVCLYGSMHYTFDNYLLIHAYPKSEALNPYHDRICFLVQRLPQGSLPGENVREIPSGPFHLCVMDLSNGAIVAELPILEPFDFKWDDDGRHPVPNPQREEFERAKTHMNTGGKVGPEDPLNDPERLEYYLFYYDPRYVRESPMEYATRMRDEYRRKKAMSAQEPAPAPAQEPAPATPAPTQTPAQQPSQTPTPPPAQPHPTQSPTQTPNWLLLLPLILFGLIVLVVYLVRNH